MAILAFLEQGLHIC